MYRTSLLLLAYILTGCSLQPSAKGAKPYDMIVYGGCTPAIAAAIQASNIVQDKKKILMVVPEHALGSIQTVGGQNFWDVSFYKGTYTQGGSFTKFIAYTSQFYPTKDFASYLNTEVVKHPNIEVRLGQDIQEVQMKGSAISEVTLTSDIKVTAPVFIDASETGRLASKSPTWKGTVGREDTGIDQKQMASTLMFKLKGIDYSHIQKTISTKGIIGLWDGKDIDILPIFEAYRQQPHPYRIKSYNAAEDGKDIFWMNMLLIYDVDGTSEQAKADARKQAIAELQKPGFLPMIRQTKGFSQAEFVLDAQGKPEVGDILYTRETIHTQNEDGSFALDKRITKGDDGAYYAHRIGLGYYWFDSNSYTKEENPPLPIAKEPWYVPYEVLVSPYISNLVIPGYAANIDSTAWTAMRVYPNLIVMGDAAGISAGLASLGKFELTHPTEQQILLLQTKLMGIGAKLNK